MVKMMKGPVLMNTQKYLNKITLLILAVVCIFATSACERSEMSPTSNRLATPPTYNPDEQRILSSFLIVPDLPEGWFRDYFDTEVIEEGDTVYVEVLRPIEVIDQPQLDYIFVSQEIVLYENESQAKEGYQEQLQPMLALEPEAPVDINFQSLADESRVGCAYSTIDIQPENVCTAVARYDRLISILTAKVWDKDDEDQWFTWTDLERVLNAMDRRALEAAGR
jgi:hypothetical protein